MDNVPPKAIIVTTFTEKAAKNIQDRLAVYKTYLDTIEPNLRSVDLFQLRIGTLHSLCNDIMQEHRYPGYQNYRLLDEIDQLLFVYEHCILASSNPPDTHLDLWRAFHYLVNRYSELTGGRWNPAWNYVPHRWIRANATVQLFNRLVEDRVDVAGLASTGSIMQLLVSGYQDYQAALEGNLCCDFSHLQQKFVQFLTTPSGQMFLRGDGTGEHPGIQHVLVDEYQDTNLIQEEIYLRLAQFPPHNLCVVGDDDQALYRFRGGTVECMVNFDQACRDEFAPPVTVTTIPLSTNYRSHPNIVNWCDEYIRSFTVMVRPGARVAQKPALMSDPNWQLKRETEGATLGTYPSVSFLVEQSVPNLANSFAQLVEGLLANNIIDDVSQCVLLMRSTRENKVTPYQNALLQRNIHIYNPRSRSLLHQPEVQVALGALVTILDSRQQVFRNITTRGIRALITDWITAYNQVAQTNAGLRDYVENSVRHIAQTPPNQTVTQVGRLGRTRFPATIQEILYHIISFEPFLTWQNDPERTVRIAQLTKLLESYCALPFANHFGSSRGVLRTDQTGSYINSRQLDHFYHALVGLLASAGLNDPENEDEITPRGRLPVMTVHQAKGLEFPFVFVVGLGIQEATVGAEIQLEDVVRPFRANSTPSPFTAQERAEQDNIRFFYVAYSRAQYALIMLSTAKDLRDEGLGFGGYGSQWFARQANRL